MAGHRPFADLKKDWSPERRAQSDARQAELAAEYDTWFREQVQIGLDSANAGRLIPNEEVEAEARARRQETRRKLATDTSGQGAGGK